jgi:hypothetical protein
MTTTNNTRQVGFSLAGAVLAATMAVVATTSGAPAALRAPTSSPQAPQVASKLDQALQKTQGSDQQLRVIIRTDSDDLDELQSVTEATGGRVLDRFDIINAVTANISAANLAALVANPAVASVSLDGLVESAKKGDKKRGRPPTGRMNRCRKITY